MSPRQLFATAAVLLTLGGIFAIAKPLSLTAQPPASDAKATRLSQTKLASWLQDLNLSRDQLEKITAIRNRYKDAMEQQRQQVQQAQQKLQQAMAGDTPTAEIRNTFQAVRQERQKLSDLRLESMLAIREVLTPPQRQKFVERMNYRNKGHRNYMNGPS